MKLKNRFILIIVGTFVVPLVMTIVAMLIIAPEFVTIGKNMHSGVRTFYDGIETASSLGEIEQLSRGLPERFFLLVLDDQNQVVYRKGAGEENRLFSDETAHQSIISNRIELENGSVYTVVTGTDAIVRFRSYVDLLIFGSLLIFLSLVSVLTLRSVNGSIRKMEAATRRIAHGDLDTPVAFRGDDVFESLANSIDTMRRQIKEEHDRRTRFFTGVSHDLKTPLASITGYTQALLDGLAVDEAQRQKYMSIIHTKGKLLDRRISQLIGYIRLTNNDFQSHLKKQELVPFLEDFAALQRDEASLFGAQFEAEIAIDRDTVVPFDQDLLSRALENLLQNSYRYGSPGKPVRMLCQYQGKTIQLAFVNYHSKPIPRQTLEHLFEPFFRGDSSRSGEGFGLGLASVKSIAESHGWKVEVRSVEQEGITIFQIIIPRPQDQQPTEHSG
ncbi:MAG: ATP-binding protein [Spirochaetota bacterium]